MKFYSNKQSTKIYLKSSSMLQKEKKPPTLTAEQYGN